MRLVTARVMEGIRFRFRVRAARVRIRVRVRVRVRASVRAHEVPALSRRAVGGLGVARVHLADECLAHGPAKEAGHDEHVRLLVHELHPREVRRDPVEAALAQVAVEREAGQLGHGEGGASGCLRRRQRQRQRQRLWLRLWMPTAGLLAPFARHRLAGHHSAGEPTRAEQPHPPHCQGVAGAAPPTAPATPGATAISSAQRAFRQAGDKNACRFFSRRAPAFHARAP